MAAIKHSGITVKLPENADHIVLMTSGEYERLRHASAIWIEPARAAYPRVTSLTFPSGKISDITDALNVAGFTDPKIGAIFGFATLINDDFDSASLYLAVEALRGGSTCWLLYYFDY